MKKIYIIGDMHTVSAFRLCGVEGVVCGPDQAPAVLEQILRKNDAGIVLLTNDRAKNLHARITAINPDEAAPVIIEIPGIDDTQGLCKSALRSIVQSLGLAP